MTHTGVYLNKCASSDVLLRCVVHQNKMNQRWSTYLIFVDRTYIESWDWKRKKNTLMRAPWLPAWRTTTMPSLVTTFSKKKSNNYEKKGFRRVRRIHGKKNWYVITTRILTACKIASRQKCFLCARANMEIHCIHTNSGKKQKQA